jgi:serine/threonine-protein kinase RsbW
MEGAIKVSVPTRSAFIRLLRSVVASAAGRLGLPIDDIEDLSLAVHEAAADLLDLDAGETVLNLHLSASNGDLQVVVWTNATPIEWPRPAPHKRLTWQVLAALTDEASMVSRVDGPGIRLLKRRPARGPG